MIRQTITCDTCGIERKQANHWFEAFEHEGELRIRGLVPTKTTRAGLKHLCGQTCLHRLVDDFLAGNLASRMFGTHEVSKAPTDFAQLAATAQASPDLAELLEFESSARLIETPVRQTPAKPQAPPKLRPTARRSPAARTRTPKAAPPVIPAEAPKARGNAAAQTRIVAVPERLAPLPEVAASSMRSISPNSLSPAQSPPAQSLPIRAVVSEPPATAFTPGPETIRLSPSSAAGPFREPPSPLTPQARRAQAWERERARGRNSSESDSKEGGIRRFI